MTCIELLDLASVWMGRLAAFLGAVAVFLWLMGRLLEIALKRAGLMGLFLKFCWQECNGSSRGLAARLFWGRKEDAA